MDLQDAKRYLTNASVIPATKIVQSKSSTIDTRAISKTPNPQRARLVPKETRNSGIPHNVNFYRHLITEHDSTEKGIEWALKLRASSSNFNLLQKAEPTAVQSFSVAEKTILSQAQGKTTLDLDGKNELHKVSHLFHNRIGSTPTRGTVLFESGLRGYGSSSPSLKSMEKKWNPLPKNDRKSEKVLMYPSYDETRQISAWTTKNITIKTHNAFDGTHNFPKYEINKKASKNLAQVGHLFKGEGQTAPMINWQLSMRNYDGRDKIELPPLAELKKQKQSQNL